METSPDAQPRPRSRTALALALAAVLVGAVVLVRDGGDRVASSVDLQRLSDSVAEGCREASSDLAATTGFALDGTVTSVTRPADPGAPVRVELDVGEWFRGPPLDVVAVRLAPATVRALERDGGRVAPGARLLVSGPGWGTGEDSPAAAGCGRTRPWAAPAADDWRTRLAVAPVAPEGPVAVYPDAGWVVTSTERTPDVSGVLLEDAGCVYVAEGLGRWLPVFPASSVSWGEDPRALTVDGHLVDVGHPVRLAGTPATGDRLTPVGGMDRPRRLDPAGVPAGCDEDVPVLVVADLPQDRAGTSAPVDETDRLLRAARDGADRAGLGPGEVTGRVVRDPFGVLSVRAVVPTGRAGDLLVHVESASLVAWPHSYQPGDATLRWSEDPAQEGRLPPTAPLTELAVVDRADGSVQLLLRARPPVVVSVTAGPAAGAGRPAGRDLLDALAAVAAQVAYAGPAGTR